MRRRASFGLSVSARMPKHRTLILRRADGVPDFERYIRAIRRQETSLRIPNTMTADASVGRSVALTQLIATWAASSSSRHLTTYLPADNDDAHTRFVSRLHGLAGAYYADRVVAVDGEEDIRQPLLRAARSRISAMGTRQFRYTSKGTRAELLFVHGARRQFHSAVYRRSPNFAEQMDPQRHGELIVPGSQMNALLYNILAALNLPPRDFKRIHALFGFKNAPLGHLIYEAFRNTAEHAYLDTHGRIPRRGLRCILVATRHTHPGELRPEALVSTKHPGLDSYFDRVQRRATRRNRKLVYMLELSILDTGPGFAATMRHPADADDIQRVSRCFEDYASSKPGPNSGLGLGRILKHVATLDGFVRLRTSTAEAFYSPTARTSKLAAFPHVAGDLSNAIGTVLTIGIPLEL